jgi:hypothetical protein
VLIMNEVTSHSHPDIPIPRSRSSREWSTRTSFGASRGREAFSVFMPPIALHSISHDAKATLPRTEVVSVAVHRKDEQAAQMKRPPRDHLAR